MGPVTTVVHVAAPGTQESNRVNFGDVISSPVSGKSDILLSILLKSSVDCNLASLQAMAMAPSANIVPFDRGPLDKGCTS